MPDDSHPSTLSTIGMPDEAGRIAVLAHSMLGTATAIRGALDMAILDDIDAQGRDSMMALALSRLDSLTEQLRDLASGVSELVPAIDPSVPVIDLRLEDGTPVELYSAFNHTWTSGFEIAGALDLGYRIRRLTDGTLLPGHTAPSDLRVFEARDLRSP